MAHSMNSNGDGPGGLPLGRDTHRRPNRRSFFGVLSLVPGFAYVLLMFIAGAYLIKDPRAEFLTLGPFKFSWIEALLTIAAVLSCFEILKVSQPGIDNSGEVLLIGGVAVIQLVLIALSFYEPRLHIFKSTESISLALINIVQATVAYHVNSRSLIRTFSTGPATS